MRTVSNILTKIIEWNKHGHDDFDRIIAKLKAEGDLRGAHDMGGTKLARYMALEELLWVVNDPHVGLWWENSYNTSKD